MRTMGTVPGPVPLAYEREGGGPLVVFLHGIGGNRTNWAAQLDALADRFCAVGVGRPGLRRQRGRARAAALRRTSPTTSCACSTTWAPSGPTWSGCRWAG